MNANAVGRCRKIEFRVQAGPGSRVYVAGSFNDWDPTTLPLHPLEEDGLYSATLLLPPGRHEYKFVVDGVWRMDPNCADWVPNALGSLNSVVSV